MAVSGPGGIALVATSYLYRLPMTGPQTPHGCPSGQSKAFRWKRPRSAIEAVKESRFAWRGVPGDRL